MPVRTAIQTRTTRDIALGKTLLALREAAGLSREKAARRVSALIGDWERHSVTGEAIRRWEAGLVDIHDLDLVKFVAVCKLYGADPMTLLPEAAGPLRRITDLFCDTYSEQDKRKTRSIPARLARPSSSRRRVRLAQGHNFGRAA